MGVAIDGAWVSGRQAAFILGISPTGFRRLVDQGRLKGVRIRGILDMPRRYRRSDLERLARDADGRGSRARRAHQA